MHVFVYEYLTGGGLLGEAAGENFKSLHREGAAMVRALAADFAAVPNVAVTTLRDGRMALELPPRVRVRDVHTAAQERRAFAEVASNADWTVVIAPETGGRLVERCQQVNAAGGRLLGTSGRGLEIACDKHTTAEHLRAAGVPAPRGWTIDRGAPWPFDVRYPAVLKPRDGAGSQGVRLVYAPSNVSPSPLPHSPGEATHSRAEGGFRVEEFCPGEPVSVALLCGPADRFALPACRQRLSDDGQFTYLGGSLPLPHALAARAQRLAERAIAALPDPLGYLGIDLVLGDDADGADDHVIEINPRLTTSYIGVRAVARTNLAAALLEVAQGGQPSLSFAADRVEFDATGRVRVLQSAGVSSAFVEGGTP